MGNISTLANAQNAALSLSNLILVTPQDTVGYQPQPDPTQNGSPNQQAPTLVFNYEGEQTVALQSDITDHYVEDNSSIQDQIALRPVKITTHGYIGELNDVVPAALASLNAIANKLTTLSGFLPQISVTALNAYNEANLLYQTALITEQAAVAAWSSISPTGQGAGEAVVTSGGITNVGQPGQTKQQIMFQQLYGYWNPANSLTRTLFTVQTPWAIFRDCAIDSLRAIQDDTTRMVTDFEITFKQLRFANTILATPQSMNQPQGRAANQQSPQVNLGTSTPAASTVPFATAIFQSVNGVLPRL
jgi:hypothetical protein